MKKIVALLLASMFFIAGCRSEKNSQFSDQPVSTNMIQSAEFNQEHYIWEQFLFPTNKTTGK